MRCTGGLPAQSLVFALVALPMSAHFAVSPAPSVGDMRISVSECSRDAHLHAHPTSMSWGLHLARLGMPHNPKPRCHTGGRHFQGAKSVSHVQICKGHEK
jgi:hypothetical protein